MNQDASFSARLGPRFHRLPDGAERLSAPPAIVPLPGAKPPLRGLVAHKGALMPAMVPLIDNEFASDALQWVRLPHPLSIVFGTTEIRPAHDGDPALPEILFATAPGAAPLPVSAHEEPSAPVRAASADPGSALRLTVRGEQGVDIPMAHIVRIVPMGPMSAVPGRVAGALGYVNSPVGDVLVLDPEWLWGRAPRGEDALLVVLDLSGRRVALPCDRVTRVPSDSDAQLPARLTEASLGAAIAAAPLMMALPVPPPLPTRQLLVAEAGGIRFAVPADAVNAILPPRPPIPPPPGAPARISGMCSHRGEVLPVIDTGRELGTRGSTEGGPLLRLAVTPSVALTLDGVPTLRRLPETVFTPVGGVAGLVESVARLDDRPLIVCRPASLAALATASHGGIA